MPYWYYEKKELRNTPSIQDGIDYETECRYRKEGARFIIDVGSKLELGYNTMATGVVYFHRFYMFHSFKTFPRYVSIFCNFESKNFKHILWNIDSSTCNLGYRHYCFNLPNTFDLQH